ncbi:MAG: nitric-oxide reductase large subunit [Planctomycetes bacterium]|nr:nitric-oxide reductase large subunit [Planctomycetota bacterium]
MRYAGLWVALLVVVGASFSVLSYYGYEIYQKAPPIPERVVTTDGQVLWTAQQIRDGQNVWQSMGGQEVGSVWGHGAYVAPDWSADRLHREAVTILDQWAQAEQAQTYGKLPPAAQASLRQRLRDEMRTNTYDPTTGDLVISPVRAAAVRAVNQHYDGLFGGGPELAKLRAAYAIPTNSVPSDERRHLLNGFFFWAAWTCVTNRPGEAISYTNNWPADDLVGNHPTGSIVLWSGVSVILLLAGIGALTWYFAVQRSKEVEPGNHTPAADPLLALKLTPSMRATLKYFWVVAALIVLQVLLGAVTAHYGVEGEGFYGIPLAQWLPYAVTRTWHTQLGIFWIATAWLATGLFLAPAVSGKEPRLQRAGVNFLFVCLLTIVGGTLFGTWYATRQKMGLTTNFWFGHQGYEYVDLGRFWQIFLFVGLFVWLGLMGRGLWPALRERSDQRPMLGLFLIASIAIALFYGAGLMVGRHTHLAMAEYWRWWVVHLWVEGFFEVFATVAIAFLFTRMGLLRVKTATSAVLFSTVIFLSGGIIGTMHHLYFTGTPTAVLAFGSVFSALEVVPLTLIGYEAYENLKLTRARPWVTAYKWPIYFFVAVAFWNMVGAGLFGFLINPPIALYYMQGLNTTPVHGHTALFGVYGMLGIGLTLFCLRAMSLGRTWRTRPLAVAFWSFNIGLVAMVVLSMLPIGLMQTWASIEHGMWHARSAEFMQQPILQNLRWMRVVGDVIFAVGVLALAYFVAGLKLGWSIEPQDQGDVAIAGGTTGLRPATTWSPVRGDRA